MALLLRLDHQDLAAAPVALVPLRTLIDQAENEYGSRRGSRPLPAPIVAEVLRLWDDGRNTMEISAAVGIAPSTAADYVRMHRDRGAPRRPSHYGRIRDEVLPRIPELVEAYKAGESLQNLAYKNRVHITTMQGLLIEAGVRIRPAANGGPWISGRVMKILDDHGDDIVASYCAGDSLERIGARYGISWSPVERFLMRRGVELRHGRIRSPRCSRAESVEGVMA